MRGATSRRNGRPHTATFQSTLLMRGATINAQSALIIDTIFQSTLLMRGATGKRYYHLSYLCISIHAPHARSDRQPASSRCRRIRISIHAPHARSDLTVGMFGSRSSYFNPRSSCEERLFLLLPLHRLIAISIHAPHARSDVRVAEGIVDVVVFQSTLLMRGATVSKSLDDVLLLFQSTLLMRGATKALLVSPAGLAISIHAPHARSDDHLDCITLLHLIISIHAPHARSDEYGDEWYIYEFWTFQSTLLMRGATSRPSWGISKSLFQSTLLMRGATEVGNPYNNQTVFQSTLLMRGATVSRIDTADTICRISIHAPHARSDLIVDVCIVLIRNFNPRSSCEERRAIFERPMTQPSDFNPRSSCEERLRVRACLDRRYRISIHAPHARSDMA